MGISPVVDEKMRDETGSLLTNIDVTFCGPILVHIENNSLPKLQNFCYNIVKELPLKRLKGYVGVNAKIKVSQKQSKRS